MDKVKLTSKNDQWNLNIYFFTYLPKLLPLGLVQWLVVLKF